MRRGAFHIVMDVLKAILDNASVNTFLRLCSSRRVFPVLSWTLPFRVKLYHMLLGNICKHAIVERALLTSVSPQWHHTAMHDVNNKRLFPHVRLRVYRRECIEFKRVLDGSQLQEICSWRRPERVNWRLHVSSFQVSEKSFQFRSRWVEGSKVKWVKVSE
jgi:hypothetical protein